MASNSKSISSSHSIPFNKHATDAFQDMTAFTPPAESWIIRYPNQKTDIQQQQQQQQPAQKEKKTSKHRVPEANQLEDPCRRYIETSEIPVKSHKSLGTDDHFKSAVCSKNLLKVCEKLLTKKEQQSQSMDSIDDEFDAELSLMNEKSRMEFYRGKYGDRRNSQSLPASPKMDRKNPAAPVVSHNPYFTITKPIEPRPESGISFLTSLFGLTAKAPAEAKANLAQKYEYDNAGDKTSATNDSAFYGEKQQQQPRSRMTPKPHEYREMNIFSPTSM